MTTRESRDARIAALIQIRRVPTQANYDARVALLMSQRLAGMFGLTAHTQRLNRMAQIWPQFAQKPVPRKIDTST